MPVHLASSAFDSLSSSNLVLGAFAAVSAYGIKVMSGGRKSIWEREWAGKLIMIVAPPEPTTFALLHHLLHLPSPPQILYLPPLPSPLPASLVTILHTIKLAATNPAAQLHCEPLPPTVGGVRLFTRKWAAVAKGTTGEEGRRVDAIVLGGGWECALDSGPDGRAELLAEGDKGGEGGEEDNGEGKKWTTHQFHFHLLTSLLPSLLKAPAERDIRLISLVSPAWPAAVPRLEKQLASGPVDADGEPSVSAPKKAREAGMLERAGADGLTTFFFNAHFKLILDALASATYSQRAVPDPTAASGAKKVEVSSNIKALSVVMPWARDEVCRPLFGRVALGWLVWLLLYPLVLLFTPGPSMAAQSVLFALSAPVLYEEGAKVEVEFEKDGPKEGGKAIKEKGEQRESTEKAKETVSKPTKIGDGAVTERRSGVKQGDVVRDCAVIDLPPVMHNRSIARGTYDRLEAEVEAGVREYEAAEKARAEVPKRDTKVKFADGTGKAP